MLYQQGNGHWAWKNNGQGFSSTHISVWNSFSPTSAWPNFKLQRFCLSAVILWFLDGWMEGIQNKCFQKCMTSGHPLAVQWLGLRALTAKGPASVPGWGTKIPQATQWSQIYIYCLFLCLFHVWRLWYEVQISGCVSFPGIFAFNKWFNTLI